MDIVSEICIYFLWLWRKINPLLPVTRSFIKNFFWVCWENRRKSSKESDRKIAAYFLAVDQRGFGRSELDASSSNVVGGVEFRETQTKVIQSEREEKSFPWERNDVFLKREGKKHGSANNKQTSSFVHFFLTHNVNFLFSLPFTVRVA